MLNLDYLCVPVLLYAETHFRFFRFFPSLLFKKFPEVLFDLPRRVGPGRDLPVVLLLNDIGLFPAQCDSVRIAISRQSKPPLLFTFDAIEKNKVMHPLSPNSDAYLFWIPRARLGQGVVYVNCTVALRRSRKTIKILNDNLPGSSKLPFSCFIAEEALPGNAYSSLGDVHVHSHYSQSHVEFGPPLSVIDEVSKSYGNDFVVVTDHSYDLACSMHDYLKPDPQLSRWESLLKEVFQNKFKNIFILGEEVSCLNARGKVIHLCAMGLRKYLPGTLDGARRLLAQARQMQVESAITEVHEQQGVAFAAHPGSTMGFMQRIFLKRGNWEQTDYRSSMEGIQGVNNGFGKSWRIAKTMWIKELLKEHKLSLAAGNDSHGDFNRYRYLSIPFIAIKEQFNRYFSYAMTGIYAKASSQQDVIQALKNGRTYITTGPFLCIGFSEAPFQSIVSVDDVAISNKQIAVSLVSTKEFGLPYCIRLYCGDLSTKQETRILFKPLSGATYSVSEFVRIPQQVRRGYIRAEAECKKEDGALAYCATSPCYFYR